MDRTVTRRELYQLVGRWQLVGAAVCLVGAALAFWGYRFASTQVQSQLGQEKISFPPAGSSALDPNKFPGLQQYAGQVVSSGIKARAYANEFIWVHMMTASGGKTYAEVSTAAQANPSDTKLANLKMTLFQGDMLRASLLSVYGFSVFGSVAGATALALLVAAFLLTGLGWSTLRHAR